MGIIALFDLGIDLQRRPETPNQEHRQIDKEFLPDRQLVSIPARAAILQASGKAARQRDEEGCQRRQAAGAHRLL